MVWQCQGVTSPALLSGSSLRCYVCLQLALARLSHVAVYKFCSLPLHGVYMGVKTTKTGIREGTKSLAKGTRYLGHVPLLPWPRTNLPRPSRRTGSLSRQDSPQDKVLVDTNRSVLQFFARSGLP